MAMLLLGWSLQALVSLAPTVSADMDFSTNEMLLAQISLTGGRPADCPPCFNCLLPAHVCSQFSDCNPSNGICACPDGFGGDNCLEPLCASLPKGKDRPMRSGNTCACDDGWTGINCNVCTSNHACNSSLPVDGEAAVCYQGGDVIHRNFQICDVTNNKIRALLGDKKPRVTFTCSQEAAACDFQFWVDERESFYCHLSECESKGEFDSDKNSTEYNCDKIQCSCIPDRIMCGENGSLDITDFLTDDIHGPGVFECLQESGGLNNCAFKEPAMDDLIMSLIGDSSIFLTCRSGECLHRSEVPGYERPIKKINTPLIIITITLASLFLLGVIVTTWLLSRRKLKHGPIHLDELDDEAAKLMTDHTPASLYFDNVSYTMEEKQILTGIRGVVHPGEITAIIGASGAGKTTLIDILARKNKRGVMTGDFYVNGEKVSDAEFQSAVGFVDQDDTMLSTLTVHETILNSALLRLPRAMSRPAKEQRVLEVEKQLGILHIRDSLIGSEEGKGRGISGGEKRRVGIACELVTSPSILFLDEPTSGLDAYNAYNVIECLVMLAKNYMRTVVFTIHQPRSNIVALFDRLILLAHGKPVYSGPLTLCQQFFDQTGYSCPAGFNIADYLVDLTVHASSTAAVDTGSVPAEDASVGPSSITAVKSVASESAASGLDGSSSERSPSRYRLTRNESVRARQERDLFTRKPPAAQTRAGSPASYAGGGETDPGSALRAVDDSHDLPPTAGAITELDALIRLFAQSAIAEGLRDDIQHAVAAAATANGQNAGSLGVTQGLGGMGRRHRRIGYLGQFLILSQRTWKNLYRNPMLMLTHYAIAIALAVLSGYLFYGLLDDISGFQNRLGLFFFLLALFGFSTLTSLQVFAAERLLFVRERANGYYSPVTYFAAKVLFDVVPLRVLPPIIMGAIIYPMTWLVPEQPQFLFFLLTLILFNLAASAICLFIGIICKDGGVANLIGSLVMLFSLLFAGLLLNHNTIPKAALWLQSLSIFHYGFEALIVNEVVGLTLVDVKYGLEISIPGATILTSFGFSNAAMHQDIVSLAVFAAVFIVLAYAAMHFLLVEKR